MLKHTYTRKGNKYVKDCPFKRFISRNGYTILVVAGVIGILLSMAQMNHSI